MRMVEGDWDGKVGFLCCFFFWGGWEKIWHKIKMAARFHGNISGPEP